jgi:AbiU2
MRTDQQIEAAAAAAAEKANGGKFTDPLFYMPEHRAFWKEVIRTALNAADAEPATKKAPPTPVSNEEVQKFSEHCVYIRVVWTLMMRTWRDTDEAERKLMEGIAPIFFADIGQALTEMMIIAACRITDRANSGGNENFTVELFANSFASDPETHKQLDALHERMKKLRTKILPARHKLGAHADRDVIRKGQVLGKAEEWEDF